MRDEAEIRGHRRTYVGALPGRIIQTLRRVESSNPVILLDELDKVGSDFRGDPASALLEVLDPAQNNTFMDHYLDVPWDLSRVLFLTTANWLDPIHPALRDRLEVIELPSYTAAEKVQIARRHLVPRQLEEHGLKKKLVRFPDATLRQVIQDYTREAGVRQLEREIAALTRKAARKIVARKSRARALDHHARDAGRLSGPATVHFGSGRAHSRIRHSHRPGVDAGGRGDSVYRGHAHAGKGRLDSDRFAGRSDEGERANGVELFAQSRRRR